MRISLKHQFIWVSKPKTGSTSFRKLLDSYSDFKSSQFPPFRHHVGLATLQYIFGKRGWDFDSFYKIVAVRNPWDLLVSLFCYSETDVNGVHKWEIFDGYKRPSELMSFCDWVRYPEHRKWFTLNHALSSYTHDENGENLANLVFAVDQNTSPFFEGIRKNCGLILNETNLSRLNQTQKSEKLIDLVRDTFVDPEVNKMVHDIFGTEIQQFNYTNPYT